MDYNILKIEIDNDPLGRGYSSMSNADVANDLNTSYRSVTKNKLSGSVIFNAIVPAEFSLLSDTQKQVVRDVFSLGDSVDIGPGTNARIALLGAFAAGTTTRANLINAVSAPATRAQELGLGRVRGTDISYLRG